jgi:fermentation-respiration switch protein FrsA (DUF1100 family)
MSFCQVKKLSMRLCAVGLLILSSGCNHLFYYPHKDIYLTPDAAKLNYSEVTIPSGAETLRGWHIKASGKAQRVAIIQFHGNAENRSTHFLSVAWMAQRGVDVIVFDYRGYDGSTGKPSRQGLVEDGVAALSWFEKAFPQHRRFVVAQSLGGAVAIPALARSTGTFDGLILESTFASYRGIARRKLAGVWLTWPFQWLPWLVLSGDENPVDFAADVKLPVLAFHDKLDPVVPYESGQELYEAFPPGKIRVVASDGSAHTGAFMETRMPNREIAMDFMGMKPQDL